jgi:hypothetical protein
VSEILRDVMIIHKQKMQSIAGMWISLTLYQDCQEKKITQISTASCLRLQKEQTLDLGIQMDQVLKKSAGRQI